jgi:hypothetical protein
VRKGSKIVSHGRPFSSGSITYATFAMLVFGASFGTFGATMPGRFRTPRAFSASRRIDCLQSAMAKALRSPLKPNRYGAYEPLVFCQDVRQPAPGILNEPRRRSRLKVALFLSLTSTPRRPACLNRSVASWYHTFPSRSPQSHTPSMSTRPGATLCHTRTPPGSDMLGTLVSVSNRARPGRQSRA